MGHTKITFQKLQEFISRYDFEKIEKKHLNGRKAPRGLTQKTQFKIITFGILKGIKTLRDCVTQFNCQKNHFYRMGIKKEISLSTLSEANKNRPHEFYQDLFFSLLQKTKGQLKTNLNLAVKVLDSTTISIGDKRASWAEFKKEKFGIKVHLLLDHCETLIEDIKITKAKDADIKIAKTFEFQPKTMYVMDRAYFDAEWLLKQHKKGVFFAMRLKKNILYYTIKEENNSNSNVVASKTIQLSGSSSEQYSEHLKLYVLKDEKSGKTIEVITNNFDLSGTEISTIYRQRWDIEVFFRWIKQNLQVKRFYGRSENAMKTQIWIALILYLILWSMHKVIAPKEKLLDFLRKFKSRLFQSDIVEKKTCGKQLCLLPQMASSG